MNYFDSDKFLEEMKQQTISNIIKLITTGESDMENLKKKIRELEEENKTLKQLLDDKYNILILFEYHLNFEQLNLY